YLSRWRYAGRRGDRSRLDHADTSGTSRRRGVCCMATRGCNAMSEVTRILSAIEQGDHKAAEQLLPLVYDELRRLAAQRLAQEKPGQTLQGAGWVHGAILGLGGGGQPDGGNGRGHFFAAAAEAMRRILVDRARRKKRPKHGGARRRVDLDQLPPAVGPNDDLL